MLNFAGQDIRRGDYIGQVARTNQGMKHRVGVVMSTVEVEVKGTPQTHLQVIWATRDFETGEWDLSDGNVSPTTVFKIDADTITYTTFLALDSARQRGHA